MSAHRIAWYVYAGAEKIRRTATMRGAWGYDVECSCGWKTTTGGAVKRYIEGEIWLHKLTALHCDNCEKAFPGDAGTPGDWAPCCGEGAALRADR